MSPRTARRPRFPVARRPRFVLTRRPRFAAARRRNAGSGSGGPTRSRLGLALAVASCLVGPTRPLVARTPQEGDATRPTADVAFALDPDTVRVGEPFTLAITVQTRPGWRVGFPDVLPLPEGFEQRTAGESAEAGPARWRAYYRLVAWEVPGGELPPVEIELATDGELRSMAVRPPPIRVRSVLPEDEANLQLRPARPFLERSRFPWLPVLLAALALAALAWWILRRREGAGADSRPSPEPAAERALRELRELRERWEEGSLDPAEFYDGLEGALRRYAEATRGWPPGTLIWGLPNGDRELAGVLRRSALARFGRAGTREGGPTGAIEVCRAWLLREREGVAARPAAGESAAAPASQEGVL